MGRVLIPRGEAFGRGEVLLGSLLGERTLYCVFSSAKQRSRIQ